MGLCEMHTDEKQAYEMANESTRLWKMHACERHAYEIAPVRGTPMGWPMRDARP